MDFNKFFTVDDMSGMYYYYVFLYFYNKLRPHFMDDKAGSIAAELTIAFLDNYELDSDV